MSVSNSGKNFLRSERGGKMGAVHHRTPDIGKFLFDETVVRDFSDEIERAQKRNAVLSQGAERAGKLCVITMPDDAAVAGNVQAKTVPRRSSFIAADERAPSRDRGENDECASHQYVVMRW